MAWIKMETSLGRKPEVLMLSDLLEISVEAVIGHLFSLWAWFDEQSLDGDAPCVTQALVDRLSNRHGFADALQKVGWMNASKDGISLPNFDRHNGATAKRRALSARRNQGYRMRDAPRDACVTQPASPREEKIREEKKEKNKKKAAPTKSEQHDAAVAAIDWESVGKSDQFKTAFLEFCQHRRDRRDYLTPLAVRKLLSKLEPHPEAVCIQSINDAIANGWKGVFPESVRTLRSSPTHTDTSPETENLDAAWEEMIR